MLDVHSLRQILVIRLSAIGDILLTTPILRLLRAYCPQARIDFLTKAAYHDLIRAHPCVDRVLLVPPQQGLHQTLQALRQTPYDMVLDVHRTLRTRLLARGLAARHKLHYHKRPLRRALLVHLGWNTLRPLTAVPELYAAPLRRLGMHAPLSGLEMHIAPESHAMVQAYCARVCPQAAAAPLLAVAPGAQWPTKRWLVERFADVARAMAHTHKAAIVLLGSAADRPLAQAIQARLPGPVLDSTGQLSLMETAALLQQCRLLLCNDSGLMHMATALGVPVVAIFGPTVEEFGFYPFHAQAQVLSAPVACRPCSTKGSARCPRGHHACMQHVTTTQVLEAAHTLWREHVV